VNGRLVVRDLVALADDAHDLSPHFLHGDVEGVEHPGRKILLAEQPEQDVLGADVLVPERPWLVVGENDDLPSLLSEPLEHPRAEATARPP
jgi:hypothetical protein